MHGNKMKVFVTGSNGMLGSNLLKLLPFEVIGFTSTELDITDSKKIMNILEKEKPKIIIQIGRASCRERV